MLGASTKGNPNVWLSHPPTLQTDKLVASIGQFIAGFADRTGLDIKMGLSPQLDQLSFQMQRTLLRVTQEALANVHRHAAASRVRVHGRVVAGRVHLLFRMTVVVSKASKVQVSVGVFAACKTGRAAG